MSGKLLEDLLEISFGIVMFCLESLCWLLFDRLVVVYSEGRVCPCIHLLSFDSLKMMAVRSHPIISKWLFCTCMALDEVGQLEMTSDLPLAPCIFLVAPAWLLPLWHQNFRCKRGLWSLVCFRTWRKSETFWVWSISWPSGLISRSESRPFDHATMLSSFYNVSPL